MEFIRRDSQSHWKQWMDCDKSKGIISKSMPIEWYQRKPNLIEDEDEEEVKAQKRFNQQIVVDKKPYFFAYVYPSLGKEYRQYLTNANRKALFQFGVSLDELLHKETTQELTSEEQVFLHYYRLQLPLNSNPCVMNQICWKIERAFDGWLPNQAKEVPFDYQVLKSGHVYSHSAYSKVKDLYALYVKTIERSKTIHKTFKKQSNEQHQLDLMKVRVNFKNEALKLCSNEQELCDMMLDFCYQNGKSKRFVWDTFGSQIIENLKSKSETFSFPVQDELGDISFKGLTFKMVKKEWKGDR